MILAGAAALVTPVTTSGQPKIKGKVSVKIPAGFDLFETSPGTSIDFKDTPLPAGFFDPGSEPVTGQIPLVGVPLGYFHGRPTGETDTVVQRLQGVTLSPLTGIVKVPIQIVQLSLQSVEPLTVTYLGGTEKWEVHVGLSATASPHGTMTIHGHDRRGGTFDSTLPVMPTLTFTRLGDRKQVVLDVGALPAADPLRAGLELHSKHVRYTYGFARKLLKVPGLNNGFCAGCTPRTGRSFSESSQLARHKARVPARLARIPHGFDIFQTQPGTKFTLPASFPIPADFFGPGSQPFSGTIDFRGAPIGNFRGSDVGDADTVVQRKRDAHVGPGNGKDTIPIEVVQLSLVSNEPIQVMTGGATELWDVRATVSQSRHSSGTMTIRKRNESGGTFDSKFRVFPLLMFTSESTGVTKQLDVGAVALPKSVSSGIVFSASKVPWQKQCRAPALHVPGLNDDFCPSFGKDGQKVLTQEQAMLAAHGVMPAQPIYIPPIDCPLDPPIVNIPPGGGSGDTGCVLNRMEGPHSFFDIFVEVEFASPVQGIGVQLSVPKGTLRRGETTPMQVHVTGAADVAPGTYDVKLKVRASAGADQAVNIFHLPVTVQQPEQQPPKLSGTGQFSPVMGFTDRVNFTIAFDQATTGFAIRIPGMRQITGFNVPGYMCAPEIGGTTNDQLRCNGDTAANTGVTGMIAMNPNPQPNMGGQLYGYQGGTQYGPFTITGP